MKLPGKCGRLPSIAASLRRAGYATEFLYGGDINFTNTNGYLLSTGYERTYGETSFPASVRRTHDWGVTDRIAFDSLYARIVRYPTSRPWHLGFLTLARRLRVTSFRKSLSISREYGSQAASITTMVARR